MGIPRYLLRRKFIRDIVVLVDHKTSRLLSDASIGWRKEQKEV
jgi:hypothetical protein